VALVGQVCWVQPLVQLWLVVQLQAEHIGVCVQLALLVLQPLRTVPSPVPAELE